MSDVIKKGDLIFWASKLGENAPSIVINTSSIASTILAHGEIITVNNARLKNVQKSPGKIK